MTDADRFIEPRYPELWMILLTGLLHVLVELSWGGGGGTAYPGWAERVYNASAILLWGLYVLWHAFRTPALVRCWGLRADNMLEAIRPCLIILILGAAALLTYGAMCGRAAIPRTAWIAFLLYPFYGIAQQFALQALITTNLRGLIPGRAVRTLVAAGLFSAAHTPDGRLMALTFPSGLVFTWLYERHPNLWAIGVTHGVLGALAYYLVLGLDPGAEILEAVRHLVP
jgi:membrane protease YdiL (CAAX protease family)